MGLTTNVYAETKRIISGNEKAKITIIAYESLTCSHCADFHKNVAGASNAAVPNDLGIKPGLIKSNGCFDIRGKKMRVVQVVALIATVGK